jgi:hypothetical protein
MSIHHFDRDQEIVVYVVQMVRWDGNPCAVTGYLSDYQQAVEKAVDLLEFDSEYYCGAKIYEEHYRSRRSSEPYSRRLVWEVGE